MTRILAITGTTASGKTELSLAVAERLGGEIVSMDSRQVYIGMDVGTAKADAAARRRVPHHGLDLVRPDQRYSAGHFARDARRWVADIERRGRVPVFVGGTGFFLKAVMEPIFAEPDMDETRVAALRAYFRGARPERLARWVRRLDPERADVAVAGGPHRMGRALEVALLSGIPLSTWHRTAPPEADGLPALVVVLDLPAEELDRRIDARVTALVARGWVEEVRALLAAGYGDAATAMTGHGYREIAAHVRGERTLEEAMDDIRTVTRQYARRQRTWFRNQLPDAALPVDGTAPLPRQVDRVVAAWNEARAVAAASPGGRA